MKLVKACELTLSEARRHGHAIARKQALRLGVLDHQLQAMVETGILLRAHPGVYIDAGRRHDPLVAVTAASMFVGSRGIISHQTAAWLLGLVERLEPVIHATVVSRPKYRGLRFHLADALPPALSRREIRCTLPSRTIVDMGPDLSAEAMNSIVDRGLVRGITRIDDLKREAEGHRRGAAILRRSLIGLGHIGAPDESQLEAEMRRLIQRYGLAAPEFQVKAGPNGRFRVDCAWRDLRLVVELYGYTWHHSPEHLQHDLARQRQLAGEGWTVIAFTWQDVKYEPDRVADELVRAMTMANAG
jgi:very-short-patch-repair endonuclease